MDRKGSRWLKLPKSVASVVQTSSQSSPSATNPEGNAQCGVGCSCDMDAIPTRSSGCVSGLLSIPVRFRSFDRAVCEGAKPSPCYRGNSWSFCRGLCSQRAHVHAKQLGQKPDTAEPGPDSSASTPTAPIKSSCKLLILATCCCDAALLPMLLVKPLPDTRIRKHTDPPTADMSRMTQGSMPCASMTTWGLLRNLAMNSEAQSPRAPNGRAVSCAAAAAA